MDSGGRLPAFIAGCYAIVATIFGIADTVGGCVLIEPRNRTSAVDDGALRI
jgi:hypothetical protein